MPVDPAVADLMVRLRRSVHQEPELGLALPRTQEKVLDALRGIDARVTTGKALDSVIATLTRGREGPAVLLRADMDALPLTERAALPFASRTAGAMHACGHDLHTAMLVGAAHLLDAADFPGTVVLMFQPGEEGCHGAELMIREGVLEVAGHQPAAAFAVHVVASMVPKGMFVSRPGPILGASDHLHVTVHGRGGHSAMPFVGADPVPAACEMMTATNAMVTRKFDPFDPVVMTVTGIRAGHLDGNALADRAEFSASVRTFSDRARSGMESELRTLVGGIAAAHRVRTDFRYTPEYPVTVNDPGAAQFVEQVVGDVFGSHRYLRSPRPLPASDDFSLILREIPGAFVALGACAGPDPATAANNHSAEAAFDESVLPDGAALYAELAVRTLTAGC